jgi:glycosyltransferase involved in cell wall biosynthesis
MNKSKVNSIIYVGRLNKNKNLRLVIEALGNLKREQIEFELHVIGGYMDNYYENVIEDLIESNSLRNQVRFYGWLTQEQILDVHTKCQIFVLPSQQEMLPVSLAEAMSLGQVVVASNVGGISEMYEDKVSGFLFERNNVKELCDILRLLYMNDKLANEISRNAYQEARQKFHPDLVAHQTLEFYKKVMDHSYSIINKIDGN